MEMDKERILVRRVLRHSPCLWFPWSHLSLADFGLITGNHVVYCPDVQVE